jgi:lysophospholipase L1-like esterase
MRTLAIGGVIVVVLIVVVVVAGFLVLVYQGKKIPVGDPQYVALGSSFAAGIGLGARVPGSPIACMRTVNSYPQQVSKLLDLPLVDVTCSGATTTHVLRGGQLFQRAQLDALRPETKLVTITSGGNDVRYVGDLSFMAARNARSISGWLVRRLWGGPFTPSERDYAKVRRDLVAVVLGVRARSPRALVVIVTYPAILPPSGKCPRLNISQQEADSMRTVGEQLAAATRAAARESHAVLIDMQMLAAGHDACSLTPWTNGWLDARGTQFHPTLLGARAMSQAVADAVRPHL